MSSTALCRKICQGYFWKPKKKHNTKNKQLLNVSSSSSWFGFFLWYIFLFFILFSFEYFWCWFFFRWWENKPKASFPVAHSARFWRIAKSHAHNHTHLSTHLIFVIILHKLEWCFSSLSCSKIWWNTTLSDVCEASKNQNVSGTYKWSKCLSVDNLTKHLHIK